MQFYACRKEKRNYRQQLCQLRLNCDCCPQEPEDLFETISQAMLNAVDRDAVSGMGVVVHVM